MKTAPGTKYQYEFKGAKVLRVIRAASVGYAHPLTGDPDRVLGMESKDEPAPLDLCLLDI
jgi:hypothetical protein